VVSQIETMGSELAADTAVVATAVAEEPAGSEVPRVSEIIDTLVVDSEAGMPEYSRGAVIPVYTAFVAFVIFSIYEMKGYAKGNYWQIAMTTLTFFLIIMPYEQYALLHHVWVYNMHRMSGITAMGVPVEEWAVYVTCPTAGCLFLQMFSDKLKNNL
jgi:lycopene cyclase domain-containing protein